MTFAGGGRLSTGPLAVAGGLACTAEFVAVARAWPDQWAANRNDLDSAATAPAIGKELRPGSSGASGISILFVFNLWRSAILLAAGDKAGKWNRWYDQRSRMLNICMRST